MSDEAITSQLTTVMNDRYVLPEYTAQKLFYATNHS